MSWEMKAAHASYNNIGKLHHFKHKLSKLKLLTNIMVFYLKVSKLHKFFAKAKSYLEDGESLLCNIFLWECCSSLLQFVWVETKPCFLISFLHLCTFC